MHHWKFDTFSSIDLSFLNSVSYGEYNSFVFLFSKYNFVTIQDKAKF